MVAVHGDRLPGQDHPVPFPGQFISPVKLASHHLPSQHHGLFDAESNMEMSFRQMEKIPYLKPAASVSFDIV